MNDQLSSSAGAEWRANWTLVAATTAGMSLASVSVYSTGIMMGPIEQELGWSRAQITSGPALVSLVAICLSPFVGLVIDKVGARPVGLLAASLLCAALCLMSLTTSDPYLWWGLWLLVGLATSAMPTVWMLPVSSLFSSGRGLAIAVTLSGTGIGASMVPVIAGYAVASYGWRSAYLALGVAWAIFALPLLFLFFRGAGGPRSGNAKVEHDSRAGLQGLTAAQGFRSPAFYKLGLAAFVSTVSGTAIILNLVPILTFDGIGAVTAASIASAAGVATILGRIAGGYLMDRYPAHLIAAGASVLAIVFPILALAFPGSATAAVIAVIVFGFTSGPKTGAIVYLAGKHLGAKAFGVLFGTIHVLIALGVGVGPMCASFVYDHSGSYTPVLWATIPIVLIAALLFLLLGNYPVFENEEALAPARGDA